MIIQSEQVNQTRYPAAIDVEIIDLRESLEKRLDDVLKIVELNQSVIDIAQQDLRAIVSQLKTMQRGGGVIGSINNKIQALDNISNNPQIANQRSIIIEQVVVLFVGTLESYLGDVIRVVGNKQANLFNLQDENEKISFSQSMLKDGFQLGDAILEHILNKKYSFQDLKSSLDVFDRYLSISIELDSGHKDTLILTAAMRNVIVHNSSKIDRQFIKQIRDTGYYDKYDIGKNIKVDEDIIKISKEAILSYADQITSAILSQTEESL